MTKNIILKIIYLPNYSMKSHINKECVSIKKNHYDEKMCNEKLFNEKTFNDEY